MKINFKKHWQAITAFAVGGAMCLGLGIFVFANHTAQTELKNDSIQETGELLLVSADGSQNNGGTSKGCSLTVSQWSEIGVYGDVNSLIQGLNPGSANDPAGQAIWASIQNAVLYGNATIFTVTLQMSSPAGTYTTPIQVVGNSPISASGNTLTIAGTNFTASPQSGYECCWSGIPVGGTVTSNITITAEFALPWWGALGATGGGILSGSSSGLNGYYYFTSGGVNWVIIGGYDTTYKPTNATNGTTDSAWGTSNDLTSGQVLVISETILYTRSAGWGNYGSQTSIKSETIQSEWFNSNPLDTSVTNEIVPQKLYTNAAGNSSAVENQPDSAATYFLLAANSSDYGADDCNFKLETYLNSNALRKATDSTSYWWLRSGHCDSALGACCVYGDGDFDGSDVGNDDYGVRPAFVLDANNANGVSQMGQITFNVPTGVAGATTNPSYDSTYYVEDGAVATIDGNTLTIGNKTFTASASGLATVWKVTPAGGSATNIVSGVTTISAGATISVQFVAPGLYTDTTYTTLQTLDNGNSATWANIVAAYPSAFTDINGDGVMDAIVDDAFVGNSEISGALVISDSITSIGDYAFKGCGSLTSVTIPNSVTSIGEYTFSTCGFTSITIPNSVTSIGRHAFRGCTSITSITIPNSVTSIGNNAFRNCTGLTSITIPNSVTSIGSYAFYDCGGLTSINFDGTVAQWNAISKGSNWKANTGAYTVYCTDGNVAKS